MEQKGESKERMTTEEFKEQLLSRVRENYMPNVVKGYRKKHGIPLTGRKNAHPERDIQTACLQWLTIKGIYHYRLNNQAAVAYVGGKAIRLPVAQKGLPDIVILGPGGRYIACEVKSPTGVQSPEQKAVQEATEKAGGLYWIVRSLDDLEARMANLL